MPGREFLCLLLCKHEEIRFFQKGSGLHFVHLLSRLNGRFFSYPRTKNICVGETKCRWDLEKDGASIYELLCNPSPLWS